MAEKSIGTFRNVKAIDLTSFDGRFIVEPVTQAVDAVEVIAIGAKHQVALVRVEERSRSGSFELKITDNLSAVGSAGIARLPIPLPRKGVIRRADSIGDPRGVNVKGPRKKVVRDAPIKRLDGKGVMVRIAVSKGTVVTY